MKTYPPAQASHTPQADAVPQLIAATAHTLPEQVNALARARAFAEPLMAGETLDSGENTLAHADAVAGRGDGTRLTGVTIYDRRDNGLVQVVMAKVGEALGLAPAKAEQVWRNVDAGVSAAAASLPEHARGIRVYFEVNRAPYAAGESSFIGQTLKRLGVGNVVPAELGPFPKLNPEFVVRANPDLIMVGQRNVQGMTERPGWQRLRAVREQRICIFNSDDEDAIVRPGPRMAEGARLLAQCILKHSAGAP